MTRRDAPPSEHYGERLRPGERAPAPWAASAVPSSGRQHREAECPTRGPFQRDRDRILHSTAFRRLTYKTQVFVFHEGDHYRTRLTHSLEVAQIARAIARQLRLDEDLAEALALAHDLGHPPFGHAGERALDAAMTAFGGFDHNAQSLRVVSRIERKYLAFDGLNLTWEALEGLAKHNGPVTSADSAITRAARRIEGWRSLDMTSFASAEAQAAALADDIAYVTHDIDDGLRAGLVTVLDLADAPLASAVEPSLLRPPGEESRRASEITRRMITAMVADVVRESRTRLRRFEPRSPADIRAARDATVTFSAGMARDIRDLKAFLHERVYRHPKVMRAVTGAEAIVRDLFHRYLGEPRTVPDAWREAAHGAGDRQRARIIADFAAGMTDRYAIAEHRRLFDATPELR